MHYRIAVHLGGRGLQDLGFETLAQSQHIDRADHAGLGRLYWIELIRDRRGRTGEIIDLVHFDKQRVRYIMPHRLEMRVAEQDGDVVLTSGEVIVDAEYVVTLGAQLLAQM